MCISADNDILGCSCYLQTTLLLVHDSIMMLSAL